MKIIILAAGRGQRYRDAGFDIPKPLITFRSKPFIVHAIEQFETLHEDIIVVGTPEVCSYVEARFPDIRTVCIEHTQRGPAMSALLAGGYIQDDEGVVLMDSDGIFDMNLANRFTKEMYFSKAAVGIMFTEHNGDTTPYCSLIVDEVKPTGSLRTAVKNLEEKTGKSSYIAVGGYGFSRWEEFRGVTMLKATEPHENEIYISKVIRYYIEKNLDVRGMYVPPEYWTSLGTPKDLDFAERNL